MGDGLLIRSDALADFVTVRRTGGRRSNNTGWRKGGRERQIVVVAAVLSACLPGRPSVVELFVRLLTA